MKKVSVIIPCYNCASFIQDTLDSLLQQTWQDFEVVCINDGSTDETLEILTDWKARNVLDLQIINKTNGGVSVARNEGIKAARGEYLLFLDSDDLYHPHYINCLISAMEQAGADVAYCRLSRCYDEVFSSRETIPFVPQTQRQAMYNLQYAMPEFGFTCYMYRRDIVLREKLNFDINTHRFEDREFNWKYLCHCKTAVLVDAPLYFYRVTQNSATQKKKEPWRTDRLDAVKRVETYMETMGCDFLLEFKSYLYPRVMWSMAKNYAVSGSMDLLVRLGKEYDVKTCMRRTAKDSNKMVALASICYLIRPSLFYHVVRLKSKRQRMGGK